MSYCRSSEDSDVYVIGTIENLECFGAGWELERQLPVHGKFLSPDWGNVEGLDGETHLVQLGTYHVAHDIFHTTSRQEMIDHLLVHRAMGHLVPDYAIERLAEEIRTAGDGY